MDREEALRRILKRNAHEGYHLTAEEARVLGATAEGDPVARERRERQAAIDDWHANPPALGATIAESPEGRVARDAFRSYIRTGAEDRAALVAGTGANGGFVVPEPLHAPLIEKYRKHSPLIQDCTVFDMNGNTTMYLPYKATHGAVASTTETGARTEQTEPTFTGGAATLAAGVRLLHRPARVADVPGRRARRRADVPRLDLRGLPRGLERRRRGGRRLGLAEAGRHLRGERHLPDRCSRARRRRSPTRASSRSSSSCRIKYRQNAKWYLSSRHPGDRHGLRLPEPQQHAAGAAQPDGRLVLHPRQAGGRGRRRSRRSARRPTRSPSAISRAATRSASTSSRPSCVTRSPPSRTSSSTGSGRFGGIPWDPERNDRAMKRTTRARPCLPARAPSCRPATGSGRCRRRPCLPSRAPRWRR